MNNNLNCRNLFNYLIDTFICKPKDLDNVKVDSNLSQNCNWTIEFLESKSKIFIKQIPHFKDLSVDNKIYKEWCIYDFLESANFLPHTSSLSPKIIHFDKKKSILIYKLTNDYIDLKNYYKHYKFSPQLIAEILGNTLAKLHFETIKSKECFTFMNKFAKERLHNHIPYSDYLINYLTPESLKKVPVQSWRFLGIFHKSEAIKNVVTELLIAPRHYCLTHNNLEFKNILISKEWKENKLITETKNSTQNCLKIINWEACSWGDPANDLGRIVTDYFIFWIDSMLIDFTINIEQSIRLATIPFEVIGSSITALMQAYVKTFPKILEDDSDFLRRVIQFAGLGLIYQLLEEFKFNPDVALEHQNLYFYMALQLLCKPQKFVSI